MIDLVSARKNALKYWERRRLFYNVCLVLPTILGYGPGLIAEAVGDRPRIGPATFGMVLVLCIVAANLSYTFAYALEFVFATEDSESGWYGFGRKWTFALGTMLSIVLAFVGGRNLYAIQYGPPF